MLIGDDNDLIFTAALYRLMSGSGAALRTMLICPPPSAATAPPAPVQGTYTRR